MKFKLSNAITHLKVFWYAFSFLHSLFLPHHQVQFHEMGEPMMKKPRRPRQARPHDEELERQIRMLLVSNFDEAECKTTWSCAQCNYSNKLQYTVKKQI